MLKRSLIGTSLATVSLLMLATLWLPAEASGGTAVGDGHTAKLRDCDFAGNFVSVPVDNVRHLVPDRYSIRTLESDFGMDESAASSANLLINLFACETVSAGETRGPVRTAYVTVEIHRPPGIETARCPDGSEPQRFDEYVLFVVTNSQAYADWLRAGTGFSVTYDPNFLYKFSDLTSGEVPNYHFETKEAPGPFKVSGIAGAQEKAAGCVDDNWWQDTKTPDGKQWTVRFHFPPHDDYFAPADLTVKAHKDSELAKIMGATEAEPISLLHDTPTTDQLKIVMRDCSAFLATAQQGVLRMLDRGTPEDKSDDLTTLRNETDLADLAALGYNFYPHHQSSIKGMGWPVLDTFTDPAVQTAARPQLLLYAPASSASLEDAIKPRDGFDFPYRLRGWAYPPLSYKHGEHPTIPGLECIEGDEWFVHERGIHTFEDGDFDPYPPDEEVRGGAAHGTTPGSDTLSLTPKLKPGDFAHPRTWDLHVWCLPDCVAPKSSVPRVSMLNPGTPIPGLDPNVGVSPPPNWPDPPYPSFFYPPA